MAMYMGDEAPKLLQQAQAAIQAKTGSVDMYVLAFDGYVTVNGDRRDAVVIEAGELKQPSGHMFAQRYLPPQGKKRHEKMGHIAYLGQSRHYLQRNTGQVHDA